MQLNFRKIFNVFRLSDERHVKVLEQIKESAKGDLDFFTLTIFAGIIITLGLILNSSAVIIGGMLMAPLVWPILAMALSMIRGSLRLFEQSLFTLFKATASILLVAYLMGLILPFNEFGMEVISRTQPTILELFIALAAGFVAAFVISYPGLGSFIAGVVIASAVVPPLCVVGLSLAEKNLGQAAGSLLLFVSNLIAMILSAALFFVLAKFKPLSGEESLERRRNNVVWSVVFLIIIIIPLIIITSDTLKNNQQIKIVRGVINLRVSQSEISDIKLSGRDDVLFIEIVVRAKNNLTPKQMDSLTNQLSEELGSSVNLKMTIIPILEAGQIYQKEVITTEEKQGDINGDIFPKINGNLPKEQQ